MYRTYSLSVGGRTSDDWELMPAVNGERGEDRSYGCLQDGGRGRNFSVPEGDPVLYVCSGSAGHRVGKAGVSGQGRRREALADISGVYMPGIWIAKSFCSLPHGVMCRSASELDVRGM